MTDAFSTFDPGEFIPKKANGVRKSSGGKTASKQESGDVLSAIGSLMSAEELEADNSPPACMWDPSSSSRLAWDFTVIMPCLVYLTIMMPYRLCFNHAVRTTTKPAVLFTTHRQRDHHLYPSL
jgi:hypothetical protein